MLGFDSLGAGVLGVALLLALAGAGLDGEASLGLASPVAGSLDFASGELLSGGVEALAPAGFGRESLM